MRVSSARITFEQSVLIALLFICGSGLARAQTAQQPSRASSGAANAASSSPAEVFQRGQEALKNGDLGQAEKDFHQVVQLDPRSGAAYANLGVVYMRRRQWDRALSELHRAEKLMPGVPGIRLNIGLAYYRQNEFLKAIPPFQSVVEAQPDALQPRYLLGLCFFFTDQWADTVRTLKPLWAEESGHFPYLYVLSNAAHRAGLEELDHQASEQLMKIGDGSAQYHLFAGKYYLNREEYEPAMAEFEAAAKQDPKLPFVHFNLGLVHMKKQEYAQAREEFQRDLAVEPDMALNYEEIGNSYWLTQEDANAEKSYREALRRDPRLVNSMLGLAKIYQKQQKYPAALAETDAALKVDPDRTDAHYLRAQALQRLGRGSEAKRELQAAAGNTGVKPRQPVPSPELMQDQQ